jgi:bleomycin hydrolase
MTLQNQTYGVVPQAVFPESFSSSSSDSLDTLLKTKLREHSLILRKLSAVLKSDTKLTNTDILAALRSKKEELMSEVWTILSTTLGSPPHPGENFIWDYLDADGKAHTWEGTPIEFFNAFTSKHYPVRFAIYDLDVVSLYSKLQALDSFSLIHDPRNPKSKLYTVEALGNIWGGRPVLCMSQS